MWSRQTRQGFQIVCLGTVVSMCFLRTRLWVRQLGEVLGSVEQRAQWAALVCGSRGRDPN